MRSIHSFPFLAVTLGLLASQSPCMRASGADIYAVETFAQNPLAGTSGWQVFGENSLFSWDDANQNLKVTWDSSFPNSYFHRAIGATLSCSNDFLLGFDLRLASVQIGTHTGMPFTFQFTIGLLNLTNSTDPGFLRGTGFTAPNLVEFSYFPDSGYGATVAPTIISQNNDYNSGGFTYPLALSTGTTYHVEMRFIATEQRMVTRVLANGVPFGPINDARLEASFGDFFVDHLAIMSFSDAGQDPMYAGSVHAEGTVDNLFLMTPPPIATHQGAYAQQQWSTTFSSHLNWTYQLERSSDLTNWDSAGSVLTGTGDQMTLTDPAPPAGHAFYRVLAKRN